MSARTYELIYILKPEANEQEVADLQAQIEAVIQRLGGTLEKTEAWGRRRLAYEIGKHKEGFYVLHVILMPLAAAIFLAVHFWRIRKDGGISGPL